MWGETVCETFRDKIEIITLRPFNIYGPGLRLDDGRVVPDFIKDALNKKQITIYSNGRVTRSFCYIADAVVAMLMLLTKNIEGEVYNVGNDEEVTITQLAKTVDMVSGNNVGVKYAKSKDKVYLKDNPHRRVPNLNKLKKTIDWNPQIKLADGLKRTFQFYKSGAFISSGPMKGSER